jgi:hypothetical protein
MNSEQQLEQALLGASLSGIAPIPITQRASSVMLGGLCAISCVVGNANFDTNRVLSVGIGHFGVTGGAVENNTAPVAKRVCLPLIKSRRPGSVSLTNAQIEALLD